MSEPNAARPARLHLVDGTYELFRAHFSKRPDHQGPGGRPAKATVGVAAAVLALLHDESEAVTHMAVAFDNPIRSFRNDLYAGYKSDEGVEADLRSQFDMVEDAVRALGVRVLSMREHEADDGMATAAARFAGLVEQVRILSPDKDLGQCLRGTSVVQVVRAPPPKKPAEGEAAPPPAAAREMVVVDEEAFRAKKGVAPSAVADFLALTGDDADGYPGLPGFGEKSAAALLGQFGRIEAIPDDPARWPKGIRGADRLAATLREKRPEALLYRRLALLVTDAPLPGVASLEDLAWRGVPRDAYETWCDWIGVTTMRSRPKKWAQ